MQNTMECVVVLTTVLVSVKNTGVVSIDGVKKTIVVRTNIIDRPGYCRSNSVSYAKCHGTGGSDI